MLNIRPGFIYKTRSGHEVVVLRTDLKSPQPIAGIVTFETINREAILQWCEDGGQIKGVNSSLDLVEELPFPEPKEEE